MIRIGEARLSYHGGDRSVTRTATISRAALALVAQRAPTSADGHITRLIVEVQVPRNASDAMVAERIATALVRRL
jgi:hypothetical protein